MFRISVTGPKGQSAEIDCKAEQATIGKADDNLVVLRGWTVGKKQATIHRRSSGFFIEDHGGLSATEVNGKAVDKEQGPLAASDVINIGGYLLQVIAQDNAVQTQGAPAPVVATA